MKPATVKITAGGKELEHAHQENGGKLLITFAQDALLEAGNALELACLF